MLSSIASLAAKHNIVPLKKLGQNFIFDANLCDKIVRASDIKPGDRVLEVGPGIGGLTRSILSNSPDSLLVIEKDSRCLDLLHEIATIYPNLAVVNADALGLDYQNIIAKPPYHIIANLPYNVGTELLIMWLKNINNIKSITVMLQKEVVERLTAAPNSKIYGRLSVICQLITEAKKVFEVSAKAFYPAPKVTSAIVKLTPLAKIPSPEIISKIEKITQAAFSQRRKTLRSSLKGFIPNIEEIAVSIDLNLTLRAENLSPEDYLSIARAL